MTAQVADNCYYHDKRYSLIAVEKGPLFNPAKYKFRPKAHLSCCWRGYQCEYNIMKNSGLALTKFHITTEENGVPPDSELIKIFEAENCDMNRTPYAFSVSKINLKLPYTGGIIIADGFISDYYIHLGFQPAYAFEDVLEIAFLDGVVKKVTDYSILMKQYRQKLEKNDISYRNLSTFEIIDVEIDVLKLNKKMWWL